MAQGRGGGAFSTQQRLEAFWAKVEVNGEDGCWPWLGSKSNNGYGRFWNGHRCVSVHVFAFETKGVPLPKGYYGCHTCDNPPCCNPRHVFAGTATHNQLDCVAKGRKNFKMGVSSPKAKFSKEQILRIRADKRGNSELARIFGVERGTIHNIKNKTSYREV